METIPSLLYNFDLERVPGSERWAWEQKANIREKEHLLAYVKLRKDLSSESKGVKTLLIVFGMSTIHGVNSTLFLSGGCACWMLTICY